MPWQTFLQPPFLLSLACSARSSSSMRCAFSSSPVTRTRPAAHWLERLRDAGVPCGEIRDYGAVFSDPHLAARGFFRDLPHPTLGSVRVLGSPIRLARTPVRIERAGPLLGEHSLEVLREAGMAASDAEALVRRGIVAVPARAVGSAT